MGMSQDAYLFWGVSLKDDGEYGEGAHPSLEDTDLWDEIESSDEFKGLELEYAGNASVDCSFPLVSIARTRFHTYYDASEIPAAEALIVVAAGATTAEIELMNRFLDHIGFTGDRTIRLWLVASYG